MCVPRGTIGSFRLREAGTGRRLGLQKIKVTKKKSRRPTETLKFWQLCGEMEKFQATPEKLEAYESYPGKPEC
jgi:hypothetical protein